MKSVRFFIMKPGCRIFLPCKNAPFLVVPSSQASKFSGFSYFQFRTHKFHTCSSRFSAFKTIFNNAQRSRSSQNRNWGQSGILSNTRCRDSCPRSHFLIACAASNIREMSTSVETHVNDKNFERIYVHGGLNAKPLAVEKINLDSNAMMNEDEIKSENLENEEEGDRLDETKSVRAGKEESEVEKEAWRLLRNAIVTYCGSPVGTLAANDPNDKLPLNYDQVFTRDFVSSAFAFLLKGEGKL